MRTPSAVAVALALAACTGAETPPAPKAGAGSAPAAKASPPGDTAASIYAFGAVPFQGAEPRPLRAYEGQVLLVANIAANCGYTPQMGPLGELDAKYKARGFRVLGFLSDDFGQQGGTPDEVKACDLKYHASFDQFALVHVKKGPEQHPLFAYLTSRHGLDGDVGWNFSKWLVDRRGQLVARWPSETAPDAPEVVAAIEREIGKP